MMLIVLDKEPCTAVSKLTNCASTRIILTQLRELMQLICSCGFSDIYQKIPQGKAIQEWIKKNYNWVFYYADYMLYLYGHYLKEETLNKYIKIIGSLPIKDLTDSTKIDTAIFRYKKDYKCDYPTNSELPIDIAVAEYKKYVKWKGWK